MMFIVWCEMNYEALVWMLGKLHFFKNSMSIFVFVKSEKVGLANSHFVNIKS